MSVAAAQFLAQRRVECLALSAWLRRHWVIALSVVLRPVGKVVSQLAAGGARDLIGRLSLGLGCEAVL